MQKEQVISLLIQWRNLLQQSLRSTSFAAVAARAEAENPWFTREHIDAAFQGIFHMLDERMLQQWLATYALGAVRNTKKVGVVMAGNIPLVGFHDLICLLASGHKGMIKPSSSDEVLLRFVLDELFGLSPNLRERIQIADRLNEAEAMIATGSDNTSRYFEYYFRHVPRIIRKNRTSVGIISGEENEAALEGLANDIHLYFGLGCRNVSKLFVPEGFPMENLVDFLARPTFLQHTKYKNNYEYHKAIYLVNGTPHIDFDGGILLEASDLFSPVSVVYYEYYTSKDHLKQLLLPLEAKLQCVVGKPEWEGDTAFGQAQSPGPQDYADGVDTLDFLLQL